VDTQTIDAGKTVTGRIAILKVRRNTVIITVPEEIRLRAKTTLNRMLAMGTG
jgi:quinolinate synthase